MTCLNKIFAVSGSSEAFLHFLCSIRRQSNKEQTKVFVIGLNFRIDRCKYICLKSSAKPGVYNIPIFRSSRLNLAGVGTLQSPQMFACCRVWCGAAEALLLLFGKYLNSVKYNGQNWLKLLTILDTPTVVFLAQFFPRDKHFYIFLSKFASSVLILIILINPNVCWASVLHFWQSFVDCRHSPLRPGSVL